MSTLANSERTGRSISRWTPARAHSWLPSLLLTLLAGPALAQPWTGGAGVGVQVNDRNGRPVAGAEVVLEFLQIEPPEGPAVPPTNSSGKVDLFGLADGPWRLNVHHPEHMSFVGIVTVRSGKKPSLGSSALEKTGSSLSPLRVKLYKVSSGPRARPRSVAASGGAPATSDEASASDATRPAVPAAEAARVETETAESATEEAIEDGTEDSAAESSAVPSATAAPSAVLPDTDARIREEPSTEEAPIEAPIEAPRTAEPAVEEAPTDEPLAEQPELQEPPTQEPPIQEPPVQEPPVQEPPVQEPEVQEPAVQELPVQEPAVQEPSPETPAPVGEIVVEARVAEPSEPLPSSSPESSPATTPDEGPQGASEPEPAATPTMARAGAQIRSFDARTCPECKPGEWAVTVEQRAGLDRSRCSEDPSAQIEQALRLLADAGATTLRRFAGSLLPSADGGAIELASPDAAAEIEELIVAPTSSDGSCPIVVAILPRGARFLGLRLEARDSGGTGDCLPDRECAIGSSRWTGDPVIRRLGPATAVYGRFHNESEALERSARLTIYFEAPSGWRPEVAR